MALADSGHQADALPGLVVASYGRRFVVEDEAGATHKCLLRGRKLRPVCGDRVRWLPDPQGNTIVSLEARRNTLARPDRRGRTEVLAANLDQLVVVIAPEPQPDPFITDRYLAAAELTGVDALLVLNKIDLAAGLQRDWLEALTTLGYPLIETAASNGTGIDALGEACRDRLSILVGVSGVGKSSLLNALVPDLDLRVGAISDASGEGRHTTTASVLHRLPNGGALIDSPGVRDYAPAQIALADVAYGFREIARRAQDCRFHNCMHLREPDCAVLAAVRNGDIDARRHSSYRRLVNLMRQLPDEHDRGGGRS